MKDFILEQGPPTRRALLLALVAGTSLLFLRNLIDVINVPKLGILLMFIPLIAAIRIAEILQGADRAGLKLVMIPALAIVSPLAVSWLFSPYKGWALFGNYSRLGGLIPYVFAVLLGVLLADAFAGRARTLAWTFAVSSGLVAFYALIQFVGLDPYEWVLHGQVVERLTTATMGNTNFAGGFLAIGFPLACGLAVAERDRRWVCVGLAVVIFLGVLVSVSQGAMVAAAAGGLVVAGFALSPRWDRARLAGVVTAALIAIGTAGAVVFTIVGPQPSPLPLTVESRGQWWGIATRMAADSPIVGRGPDVYALEGTLYRTREEAASVGGFDFTDEPHNVALWFLACAGVLGLAGFLVAIAWAVREGLRLGDDRLVAAGFFGAVVAYFVQSLVSIDTVALRGAFWIVLGGLAAATVPPVSRTISKARAKARSSRSRKRAPAQEPARLVPVVALLLVAGLAGLWWGARFIAADSHAKEGRSRFESGDPLGGAAEFQKAIDFDGLAQYRRLYGNYLAAVALRLVVDEDPTRKALAPEYYEKAKAVFSYLDHVPHANALVDYARFLDSYADYYPEVKPEAISVYRRAQALDPQNPVLEAEVERVEAEETGSNGG